MHRTGVMQTASVKMKNLENELLYKDTRLLLDCGSQRTYITENLANKLKLKQVGRNFLMVNTFGSSKPESIETRVVELGIVLSSGFTLPIKANVVPVITGKI